MSAKASLNRSLSLTQMVLYGLGTTIGAGIYALVSELAGIAGYFAPVSFLVASLIATLTALSFAELSSRFPLAAGTAVYVHEGFGSIRYSTLTGIMVALAGLVSAAALVNGFVGYLQQFVQLEPWLIITLITLLMGALTIWGIQSSVTVAGLITIIEVGGLLLIIAVSHDALASLPERWPELVPPLTLSSWEGIFAGSLLAFYAFIGFEDMVVVAEEIKQVKHNLPIAIILTLVITTLLYMLVMAAAVLAVPPSQLMQSEAPLSFLYQRYTGGDATVMNIIGLFAIINGALIQMLMASRILYGLAARRQLPAGLAYVHPRTRTPIVASLIVISCVLTMALIGHLAILAELTSLIMLCVFSMVNLALWRVKLRQPVNEGGLTLPLALPVAGFFVSTSFIAITLVKTILPG